MRNKVLAATIVMLLGGALLAPSSGAQLPDPLVRTSLGFALDDDFNADDGGWTANPVPPAPARMDPVGSWEWGAPTSGPGFAASGSNVWATNLAGDYGARECAAIMSPPITIPEGSTASVSLQHWLFSEQSTFSSQLVQDGGRIFATTDGGDTLSEVHPDQPYAGPLGTDARRCHNDLASGAEGLGGPAGTTPPPLEYSTLSADLSSLAGQTIQLAISFGTSCCTHRAGWYIDDFALTIDGVTTVEDFEASDGGFTLASTRPHPGPAKGWNHGVATDGPANDTPLWATNTEDDYGHDECATLDSPTFRVGDPALAAANAAMAAVGETPAVTASLRWGHWFRSNSLYAAGLVMIGTEDGYQVLTPDDGYPGRLSNSNSDAKSVLLDCLGVEETQDAFSGTHQSVGSDMVDLSADLTSFIGQEVSLRFIFASAWGPLNPTTQLGWYVDNVAVELVAEVGNTGPINDLLPRSERAMPPGWSAGGENSTWEYGVATSGPEGETVLGTNLADEHNPSECSYVTSPAIPGALLAANPTLSFDHWYQIASLRTSTAWSGGVVLVSTDQGATWEYLDLPEYTKPPSFSPLKSCLTAHGLADTSRVFSGDKPTFDRVNVDLSAYSGAATVQVRFLFGSYTSLTEEGWHLRAVDVAGVPLL